MTATVEPNTYRSEAAGEGWPERRQDDCASDAFGRPGRAHCRSGATWTGRVRGDHLRAQLVQRRAGRPRAGRRRAAARPAVRRVGPASGGYVGVPQRQIAIFGTLLVTFALLTLARVRRRGCCPAGRGIPRAAGCGLRLVRLRCRCHQRDMGPHGAQGVPHLAELGVLEPVGLHAAQQGGQGVGGSHETPCPSEDLRIGEGASDLK